MVIVKMPSLVSKHKTDICNLKYEAVKWEGICLYILFFNLIPISNIRTKQYQ